MYDIITIGSSLVDSFIKSDKFDLRSGGSGGGDSTGDEAGNSGAGNTEANTTGAETSIKEEICIPYGSKIEVDEYLLRTGGGAGNTAVGFARMGFRTGVITEIGQDSLSKIVLDDFKKERVSINLVVSEKQENTGGSIILVGKDGGRTVLVHRGASSMLDPEDIPTDVISRADWIHLSSISGRINTLKLIFSTLKKAGKRLSWNPGKRELALISEGQIDIKEVPCDFLFLNQEEWKMIENKHEEVLSSIGHIIVTGGKKGGRVYLNGEVIEEFGSGEVESKDDTGAGDSFVVGYITAFLKGKEAKESCQWGKKNAVSVIQQVGAKPGLLTIDQIKVHN